jgi:hypothetical protein
MAAMNSMNLFFIMPGWFVFTLSCDNKEETQEQAEAGKKKKGVSQYQNAA